MRSAMGWSRWKTFRSKLDFIHQSAMPLTAVSAHAGDQLGAADEHPRPTLGTEPSDGAGCGSRLRRACPLGSLDAPVTLRDGDHPLPLRRSVVRTSACPSGDPERMPTAHRELLADGATDGG